MAQLTGGGTGVRMVRERAAATLRLLAQFAHAMRRVVGQKGQLLLEKK